MNIGNDRAKGMVAIGGYDNFVASGQVIMNAVNVACVLHTITVGRAVSGGYFDVRDGCLSGATGVIESECYCGTAIVPPYSIVYDATFDSGIVLVTSGAAWNLTVTYRPL